MMANVKSIRPQTINTPPSQSILGRTGALSFSRMSEGMQRYDVKAVIADKIVPIQKYHPQVVYSAVTPAKKIPIYARKTWSQHDSFELRVDLGTYKKSHRRTRTINAENEVLSWSRSICAAKNHHARW